MSHPHGLLDYAGERQMPADARHVVPAAVNAEYYPNSVRGLCNGSAVSVSWLGNFCVSSTFLSLAALLGVPLSFYNALMPAWMSERFAAHGQGRVMGLLTTVFCLSNTLIALIGGVLGMMSARWIMR